MNKQLDTTYLVILTLIIFIIMQSCSSIGDAPTFPDPEFAGQWVGNGVDLLIGHDEGIF